MKFMQSCGRSAAYEKGRRDYESGKLMSQNPYDRNTVDFRAWQDGFRAARRKNARPERIPDWRKERERKRRQTA